MSEAEQIVELELGSFLEADVLQIRTKLSEKQVRNLARLKAEGIELDPVEVARLTDRPTRNMYNASTGRQVWADEGALALIHGFHRVAAAREAGDETIRAIITPMTFAEARWYAACANRKNGVPLAPADYRNVFRAFVSVKRNKIGGRFKSYDTIKQEAGLPVSRYTVRRWMQKDFPATFQAMNRQEYGMDDQRGGLGERRKGYDSPANDDPTARAAELFRQGFQNAALAGIGGRSQLKRLLTEGLAYLDAIRQYKPEDAPAPPAWMRSDS